MAQRSALRGSPSTRTSARPRGRRTVGGVLTLLLASLLVTVPVPAAQAHAVLLRSSPAEGATVAKAPTTIVLTFNEPVRQQFTTVVVAGQDGRSVSVGAARSVDSEVRQQVGPLPSGTVRVTWRTVSSDGDPIQGGFTFTSTAPGPAPSAPSTPPSPTAARAAAEPTAPTAESASTVWLWPLAGGAVAAVLLAGGVLRYRRR